MNENNFKILIVDDDDTIRETYVEIFKEKGAEVLSAKDGIEGVDLVTKEIPDIIMTGIIMPRMDGFQLIQTLQKSTETKAIPIIVFSHLGREEDRKKAQEMGIDNFIVQGSMTPNEIVERARSLTKAGGSFKLSFDSYAWDAQRLAKTLPNKNLDCPNCNEKIVIELTPKTDGAGFDAVLKCPNCGYVVQK